MTENSVYVGLFRGAPHAFDVILTNPHFGGKENTGQMKGFDYTA